MPRQLAPIKNINSPATRVKAALLVSDAAVVAALANECTLTSEGCWQWPAAARRGYGVMNLVSPIRWAEAKQWPVHRLAYEATHGRLAPSSVVHHVCANRLCCNPDHLQAITQQENVAEMRERAAYKCTIREQSSLLEEMLGRVSTIDPLHAKVRATLKKARTQHPEAI